MFFKEGAKREFIYSSMLIIDKILMLCLTGISSYP